MKYGKLIRRKMMLFHKADSQRIAERQRRRRRIRRRKAEHPRFFLDARIQYGVRIFASVDSVFPTIAMSLAPMRRIDGSILTTSAVSPLLEYATTTSALVTMPRSP